LEKTLSIPCFKPLVTDDRITQIARIEEKKVGYSFHPDFLPSSFSISEICVISGNRFKSLKSIGFNPVLRFPGQAGGAANQGGWPEIHSGIPSDSRLEFAKTQ